MAGKLAIATASVAGLFIMAFPWQPAARARLATAEAFSGRSSSFFTDIPDNALAPYRRTDLAIFVGRISCICRIQSCMSLRNNFSHTLVVALDTACRCSIVQLVPQ